jgi:aminopeptidase N
MRSFLMMMIVCTYLNSFSQNISSGGALKPLQAIMDIQHYTIALDVDISRHWISGNTTIDLNLLQPSKILVFDLLDSFSIRGITVNGNRVKFDYSKNLVTLNLSQTIPAGKVKVKFDYEGKPHTAIRPPWDDGFTWTTDSSGNPWVAVTAEGTGGKIFYPCKDHPSDEPDNGGTLLITVPKDLVVAGPGILKKVTVKNNKATNDCETSYSINKYRHVFNIGK